MPVFSTRSYQKELLDQTNIPFEDILTNMRELNIINRYLGGHRITCSGLRLLMKAARTSSDYRWTICEIGCGNGNNIAALKKWCDKHRVAATFIGVDISEACIAAAQKTDSTVYTQYLTGDYRTITFDKKPDIIFSSLFCHHFTNEQLVGQFEWLHRNAAIGSFINDLHRHPVAWYGIRILTSLFSNSYLVKNDAPLSVLRGFRKRELNAIIQETSIDNFVIKWRWAFRWLIVIVN